MFCALVSLQGGRPLTDTDRRRARDALMQGNFARAEEWTSRHAHIVSAQSGALNNRDNIWSDGDTAAGVLAGEPLISESADIDADHLAVVRDLNEATHHSLAEATGVFCSLLVREHRDGARATLVTDKLGVRILYHAIRDGVLGVSTSMPTLESLGFCDGPRDVLGIVQSLALGCPLGTRTHLQGVYATPPASVTNIDGNGTTVNTYFRWDAIPADLLDLDSASEEAHRLFLRAVSRRLGNDRSTLATLSGGLDSRCVVSCLRELGSDVVCLNQAHANSMDYVYAKQVASALACTFVHLPVGESSWFRQIFARHATTADFLSKHPVDRPRAFWAGDGGSVGMGCVYLDDTMIQLARAGSEQAAVRRLMEVNRWGFPWKLLKPGVVRDLRESLESSIYDSLSAIDCEDRGQAMLLFLMFNDQHRHMRGVYDMEPEWGVEYQLPMFDSELIRHFFRVPIHERIGHRFYNRVLKHFARPIHETPWQVYPGHEPGDFEIDPGIANQWEMPTGRTSSLERLKSLPRTFGMLGATSPQNPVSRSRLAAAGLAHASGIRDYGYLLSAAERIRKFF